MPSNHSGVRLVILDLDGVVYRGDRAVDGAAGAVEALERAGIAVRYATNNSTVDRAAYVARLSRLGITASRESIVTSSSATIEHLRGRLPALRRLMAVGEAGLTDELRAAGYRVTPAEEAVGDGYAGEPLDERYDAVVVGLDRSLDYRRLAAAVTAVREGARFVATNADARYPTTAGFLPGAGSGVAAIRAATGVEPLVVGKPQPAMFEAILAADGIGPADALVVGDNPAADIVAARRAGIRSVLVLTGIADDERAAGLIGDERPDAVLPGIADLPAWLGLA